MEIENVLVKSEPLEIPFEPEFIEPDAQFHMKTEIKDEEPPQNNDKPFKCGICGHRTMTGGLLRVHMKVHLVKRLHTCSRCDEKFFYVTELNRHVLSHSEALSNYSCTVCNTDCFTQEALNKHLRSHMSEKPLKCRLCERTFSEDAYLRVHEKSHHGEEFFWNKMVNDGMYVDPSVLNVKGEDKYKDNKCPICNKNFQDTEFLNNHLRLHEVETSGLNLTSQTNDPFENGLLVSSDIDVEQCRLKIPIEDKVESHFECQFVDHRGQKCLRRFGEQSALVVHEQAHGNEDKMKISDSIGENMSLCKELVKGKEKVVFKCLLCSKFFPVPSKLRSHMRTHTGEKPYKCEVCHKGFGTAGSLKDHSYLHSNDKPFKCTICSKGFTKNSSLEDHIRSHTGEKPYECNICKKKYTTIVILNQHLLAHSKEKPFKCDVCDKSFIYLCNLKYHMISHTGAKPYTCQVCQKSYSLKSALKMHSMEHSGVRPHKCSFCDKSFTTIGSLKKHERVHTGEKPYKCNVCSKGFTQTSSLSRHMDVHTGDKPYRCTVCNKGRDMEPGREGGSWLGFATKTFPENGKTTKHCFSCLTNISDAPKVANPAGRGRLVVDYLETPMDYPEYVAHLRKKGLHYNGYNLIGVELSKDGTTRAFHHSNLPMIDSVYNGRHTLAFGNSPVTSPLIKVIKGRDQFQDILEKGLKKDQLKDELVGLLKDQTKHLPDNELERRGPNAVEKLSSIYVDYSEAGYGTRTHTLVLVDKEWNMEFVEVTMEEPINIENPRWNTTVIKSSL